MWEHCETHHSDMPTTLSGAGVYPFFFSDGQNPSLRSHPSVQHVAVLHLLKYFFLVWCPALIWLSQPKSQLFRCIDRWERTSGRPLVWTSLVAPKKALGVFISVPMSMLSQASMLPRQSFSTSESPITFSFPVVLTRCCFT